MARKAIMAGPQGKAMAVGSHCARKNVSVDGYTRYAVRPHNVEPSGVYLNKVKAWMHEHMEWETKQWEKKFGVKEWWQMVKIEMTNYCFGFEGNQATYLYLKYKGELDESQAKPSGEIRGKIRYKQADS
jgi:hypothetical protein